MDLLLGVVLAVCYVVIPKSASGHTLACVRKAITMIFQPSGTFSQPSVATRTP